MRRGLPIVLLLALAGIVAFVLRGSSKLIEPVAAGTASAPADPASATSSLVSEPDAPRAALAPPVDFPAAARLTVHVIGKRSRLPLANIKLTLSRLADPRSSMLDLTPGQTATTDAQGVATFTPIETGQALCLIPECAVGKYLPFLMLVEPVAPAARVELTLELTEAPDGRVVGKVVCAETREPVASARVRILTGGQVRTESHAPGPDDQTTGNDGVFEIPFLLTSDPRLCVEAPGYGLRYANLDAVHTDLAHALVVLVSRAATLSVRVLDAAGAPVSDAKIELSTKGYLLSFHEADEQGFFSSGISFSFPPDERWNASTGADGRARIEGLPAHIEIRAQAVKGGQVVRREPAGLVFEPGELREVDWRIGAGTLVRGLALDGDGKPISGLEIWAAPAGSRSERYFLAYERDGVPSKSTTDSEGRFKLMDLAPGRWWIGPGAVDEGQVAPIAQIVELAGEPVLELTLQLLRGLFIRGRVLTPTGEPAANAWVNSFLSASERLEGARTGRDGGFAFGPLGTGRFTLTADAIGRFASSDPVQANAGEDGVVLQLKQGGTIRGRVVDELTGAACEAQLVFVPEQSIRGLYANGMQMTTTPDGTFNASGLEPGRWSVTASTPEGKFAQQAHIDVGAGSDSGELVLALAPGGKLRVGYTGAGPCVFVTVTRDGAAVLLQRTVQQGRISEFMTPAGSLALEIRSESTGAPRKLPVELKPGETREITLTDER